MKKILAAGLALTSVLGLLASPAVAAPPKHRAPVASDATMPFGQSATVQFGARQASVITGSGSTVLVDPDPNIVTQLLRDPDPSGF